MRCLIGKVLIQPVFYYALGELANKRYSTTGEVTPLMLALDSENERSYEACKMLIQAGVSVNSQDWAGSTGTSSSATFASLWLHFVEGLERVSVD